jgi:phosphoribosylaminoimidazole-succinocarboxamide synthase
MGSVKDLEVAKKPTKTRMGVGRFHFSDRYSVFDWGKCRTTLMGKVQPYALWGLTALKGLKRKA